MNDQDLKKSEPRTPLERQRAYRLRQRLKKERHELSAERLDLFIRSDVKKAMALLQSALNVPSQKALIEMLVLEMQSKVIATCKDETKDFAAGNYFRRKFKASPARYFEGEVIKSVLTAEQE